jgi:hypothetical protein
MRVISLVLIFTVILGGSGGANGEELMSEMQWDTDHQGSDLNPKGLDLATTDPTLCEDECARNPACKAWTYVKPNTVKGPLPKCFLKKAVPKEKPNPACVSGIKVMTQGR